MIDIYKTAKRDCNYNATCFMRMVTDYGGLETARRLRPSPNRRTASPRCECAVALI
jgi:hypothetical protein